MRISFWVLMGQLVLIALGSLMYEPLGWGAGTLVCLNPSVSGIENCAIGTILEFILILLALGYVFYGLFGGAKRLFLKSKI